MVSSQAQAVSHCMYTFLDALKMSNKPGMTKNGEVSDEEYLMTFISRQGSKVHKKLLQFLNSKSSPTVTDPVCRFIEYMFSRSPALRFEIDLLA